MHNKQPMRFLDFLFWHYYSYIEQKKTVKEDGSWLAIILIVATTMLSLGMLLGTIDTFICSLHIPQKYADKKILGWIIGIPYFLFLCFRYRKQESIVSGKYKIFRKRWGDPENVSKKNMRILLWYTLISTIGMLLYATIMGELNKHGYFEGCRLCP